MKQVLTERTITINKESHVFSIPSCIKTSDILNLKLLNHLVNEYPKLSGKAIIQGDCFGVYSYFLAKYLNMNVTVLEANEEILKISKSNLLNNKISNVDFKCKVLGLGIKDYDLYTNQLNPYSYIISESQNGMIRTFPLDNLKHDLILISDYRLPGLKELLLAMDEADDFKGLIIFKKTLIKSFNIKLFKKLKIIDDYSGYIFLSTNSKEGFQSTELVKERITQTKLGELTAAIQSLTSDINSLKKQNNSSGSNLQVNFINVISDLLPRIEKNNLLKLENNIDKIISLYEKEIYNLNKTLIKRNNKIEALLKSNTWKYTQFARSKLGYDQVTYDEYISKNPHNQSFDESDLNLIRNEIKQITSTQSQINNRIIDVVENNAIVHHNDDKNIVVDHHDSELLINNEFLGGSAPKPSYKNKRFNDCGLNSNYKSNKKFAGLAALPSREAALKRVVTSLVSQVDNVGVYLNGWDHVPEFLNHPKIIVERSQDHGDLGDAGKFFWIDSFDGYYFSCDDDLVYPPDYTDRIIDKIKNYNYTAVVGWHGSVVSDSFKDYYDPKDRRVFSYSAGRPFDLDVHILGTGVLGFHTSTIKVKLSDFEKPNMADIFFARLGQQQKVRFVVMEHKPKEIETIEECQEDSINKHGQQQVESTKNVRKYKNDISTSLNWHLNNAQSLNILLVGRFENFKKGGIHKSNLLIERYLKELGHNVYCTDSQSTKNDFLDSKIDVAMIYPGDPNRPDYPEAMIKMDILRHMGVPILLNMSYNSNPKRSKFIAEHITAYNLEKDKSKVCLMAFSESVKFDKHLSHIKKYIVSFPKTIDVDTNSLQLPNFHEREGIFFGDATKLNNPDITNGKIIDWVSEVRKRMPKTNFHVIKHYSGKFDIPNFEFAPFMESIDLMRWISNRRLTVCLNQFTTYEMVPVESQSVGIPVIYRSMPQSLNEAVGMTGVPVTEPSLFGEMCQWLYNDEVAWTEYSRLSLLNFQRNHIDVCRIGLETAMRKVIVINKNG